MRRNLIIDTDGYKPPHHLALPDEFTGIYAYKEARTGARYPFSNFFGLDIVIQQSFLDPITNAHIEEAREECFLTYGQDYFNENVWRKVQKLGYLPIHIKAVPEGTNVPINNVLFTVEATKTWFAKTAQSLEGLQMHTWYGTAVSTRMKTIKEGLRPLVEKSGSIELLDFMINDFGFRGAAGYEAAVIGGMAVMIHSQGSDNMPASRLLKDYYGYKGRAKSLWATEHSVALAFGPGEGEYEYVKHQLYNAPIDAKVAIVIDTYDSLNLMHKVIADEEIQELILKRAAAGGHTIFRPDSGTPIEQVEMCFEALTIHFGYYLNDRYYRVLNHNVHVIQGDGMDEHSIIELYNDIINNHWSSDNLFVGSGGGLLQKDIDRDTQREAIKPSWGIVNGNAMNFQKMPKSQPDKASKTGHLKLHPGMGGNFRTFSSATETPAAFEGYDDAMKTVFLNGVHTGNNFADIIERSNQPFAPGFFY